MEISVAGATFLGTITPFGLLLLAVEGRDAWVKRKWLNLVQQVVMAAVIGCALASLAFCFATVNTGEPLTGPPAALVTVASGALYASCAVFLLLSLEHNAKRPRDTPGQAFDRVATGSRGGTDAAEVP